jgi:hypothetical protein
MKILPISFVSLLLIIGPPPSALAAGKSKNATPAPEPERKDWITAIHLTAITINLYATHSAKEYKVTPATKITVNGQPSQLDGLATGMSVVVTPAPDGITAANIDAKTRR